MKGLLSSERFKAFAGFLLVMVLPVMAPLVVYDRFLMNQEIEAAKNLESGLESDLQLLMFDARPREMFCRAFEELFNNLEKIRFSESKISDDQIQTLQLLKAEGCFFNEEGSQKMLSGVPLSSKYLLRELWQDFLLKRFDEPATEIRERRYKGLLGWHFFVHDAWSLEGLPWEISPKKSIGILIWRKSKQKSGLLLFIPFIQSPYLTISSVLSKRKDGFWAVIDAARRKYTWRGRHFPAWKSVLCRAILQKQNTFLHDGFLCRIIRSPEGLWLFRALPLGSADKAKQRGFGWLIGFCLILWFSAAWLRHGTSPFKTMRLFPRLLVLFVMAILVPGVLLIVLSIVAFRERAMVLEQNLHEDNLLKLREVDILFLKRQKALLKYFRSIRDHEEVQKGNSSALAKISQTSIKKHLFARVETRQITGELLETSDKPGTSYDQMMAIFSVETLRRYLNATISKSASQFSRLAVDILLSPRLGFANVFDHPDSLNPLAIGREHVYWYWDVRKPTPQRPMAFFSISQHRKWELERFLKNNLPRGILVYDGQMRRWAPPNNRTHRLLDLLAAQALLGNQAVNKKIHWQGSLKLATAYPSSIIKNFCYLTFSDLSSVQKQVSLLRKFLLLAFVFSMAIVFLFSQMFSKAMLRPISHLSQGIDSLEKRQLEFRLPILGDDEFGQLGEAFNSIMEDLKDLDMAREVQENLIPQVPSTILGYEISLVNQSASDLGGDYCDSITAQDGKLFLIIGDVSGHGIASALLMAMAKTICFMGAQEGASIPVLFERLNKLIQKAVKKKKLMTMFVGILDGTNHTLVWSNAGHNYPIFRKADGRINELKMPQFPLGSRSKTSWKVESLSIEPGDCLFLYTDGIIEAQDENEQLFGYENFNQMVKGSSGLTASQAIDRLMKAYHEHCGSHPATDDVTLMVIRRKEN